MEPLNISFSNSALSRKSAQTHPGGKRYSVSLETKPVSSSNSSSKIFRIQKQSCFKLRDSFAPEITAEELSSIFADILLENKPKQPRKSGFCRVANNQSQENSEPAQFSIVGHTTEPNKPRTNQNSIRHSSLSKGKVIKKDKELSADKRGGFPLPRKLPQIEELKLVAPHSKNLDKHVLGLPDLPTIESSSRSCHLGERSSTHIDTEARKGFFLKKPIHPSSQKLHPQFDVGLALQTKLSQDPKEIEDFLNAVGMNPHVDGIHTELAVVKVELANKAPEDTVLQRQKAYLGYLNEHKDEIKRQKFPKPLFLNGSHRSLDKPICSNPEQTTSKYLARADLFKRQSMSRGMPSHWAPVSEHLKSFGLDEPKEHSKFKQVSSTTSSSVDQENKSKIKVIHGDHPKAIRGSVPNTAGTSTAAAYAEVREVVPFPETQPTKRAVDTELLRKSLLESNKHMMEYREMYDPLLDV
jgi:hypothetical protein